MQQKEESLRKMRQDKLAEASEAAEWDVAAVGTDSDSDDMSYEFLTSRNDVENVDAAKAPLTSVCT